MNKTMVVRLLKRAKMIDEVMEGWFPLSNIARNKFMVERKIVICQYQRTRK